jgi:raffinose/stachyose/melibiose transport system substrate-binding protein
VDLYLCSGHPGGLEGGPEALKAGVQDKITDFNTPLFVEAFTILQDSFLKNGWSGAIGVAYPDAANSFYSNQTAVLPDGTWIIDKVYDNTDWANGFDGAKVVGDYYPGNVAIANPCVYDWMMAANLPEDEQNLVYAFFEFINEPEEIEAFILGEGGSAPNMAYSDAFKAKLAEKSLLSDFANKLNDKTTFVPYFHDAIAASLFTGDFSNFLPNLYTGDWTPEQFCEELTKAAKE